MRLFALVCSACVALSGCAANRFSFERTDAEVITPERLELLDLSTFNGHVTLEPSGTNEIELEVTYKAYGMTEQEAELNCNELGRTIDADGGRVIISATKPSNVWSASVGFKVKAPEQCGLKIKTSNGAITVKGFQSGVVAESSNGTLKIYDVAQQIQASTSNGTIDVRNALGPVDLNTSNGKILLSGRVVGEENKLRTSNGRVTLALDPACLTEVTARTSNGSVKCSAHTQRVLDEGKRSMHVIVGEGTDEESVTGKLNVRTSNGTVRIEYMDASELMEEELIPPPEPTPPVPPAEIITDPIAE